MKKAPGKTVGDLSEIDSPILKCPGCGRFYRVHPEKLPPEVSSFNCRRCGSLVPIILSLEEKAAAEDAMTVLVVIQEKALGNLVLRILQRSGFRGRLASTGAEALRILSKQPPEAILFNVVLPDMLGYELIDRMKESLRQTHIPSILLASLHHGTRYKRAPTSFYGADDYIERHHLPDMLIPKLRRCIAEAGGPEAGVAAEAGAGNSPSDVEVDERREIERIHQEIQQAGEPFEEDVRRMCRVIVGDVALYNEDAIRNSVPEEALELIKGDLGEGVLLLKKRFPKYGGGFEAVLKEEMLALIRSRGVGTATKEGEE